MSWTDENIAILKKLWAEGLSANQIACRIGGMSRNAVIGKIHRMGLNGGIRATTARSRSRQATAAKRQRAKGSNFPQRNRPRSAVLFDGNTESAPVAIEELIIPLAERKTILTLTETSCRWPIGDPQHADFHFCGKDKAGLLPYCIFHARKAYVPQQPSRRPQRPEHAIVYITPPRRETEPA